MVATPQISVCIPAYDMNGQGDEFLSEAFESLLTQDFSDFEVVVADQSDSDHVMHVCTAYSGRMAVNRVDNRAGMRRASANTNFAMRQAKGRLLKILFQDDYLCDPSALGELAKAYNYTKFRWCVTGSAITRDGKTIENPMVPQYHELIRFGWNTISGPSVLTLEAGHDIWFDENLVWLMDVDMYHRWNTKFGPPLVLPETHVVNRLHAGQVSAQLSPDLRRKELKHIARKFGLGGYQGLRSLSWQYLKTYLG